MKTQRVSWSQFLFSLQPEISGSKPAAFSDSHPGLQETWECWQLRTVSGFLHNYTFPVASLVWGRRCWHVAPLEIQIENGDYILSKIRSHHELGTLWLHLAASPSGPTSMTLLSQFYCLSQGAVLLSLPRSCVPRRRQDQLFQYYGLFQTCCSVLGGLPLIFKAEILEHRKKMSSFKC